ncbi:class I SAM-dependent methyltransferase [Pleurocapsa sp. PCC 7319]|uniref:class I SAM-dependent methyltransferase n=1 Tax=Pleurocapsa sp. PCC 7319 TaxID=118161 RepID=UPI00034CB142|nr:class I SAM-dependent methyltransferase [Pleurocapsa sp. PCC 7319]
MFSEVSSEYAKYRANYANNSIEKILEGFENLSQLIAVDVGAGTGIASRQIAERGIRVLAVEPDLAMIRAATPHPLVEFRETAAEATNLPDGFADIVTCFTAFHWFDFERSLKEFQRILKPSGRLALVWNSWDSRDLFTRRYSQLLRKASQQYRTKITPYNNFPTGSVKLARMAMLWHLRWIPYFQCILRYRFAHQQVMNLAALVGCARSQSFVPHEGAVWEQLVADLGDLVESRETTYHLAYRTTLFLSQPLHRAA